jgi:hypothetical protein
MSTIIASTLVSASIPLLCRANIGILNHKLILMNVMRTAFGPSESLNLYQKACPIVHASVGQHIRHSLDHIELVAHAATCTGKVDIHYDLRARGGPDEHDMDMAQIRIQHSIDTLSTIMNGVDEDDIQSPILVDACFMLSGDPQEFRLSSTVQRELGFAAHHAIHHMALIKIIALETLKVPSDLLPSDFGRAPSTVVFEKRQEAEP